MKQSKIIDGVLPPPFVEIANYTSNNANKKFEIISFGQGVPFFTPPKPLLDKLFSKLSKFDYIHKYSNDEGLPELRKQILAQFTQVANLNEENVLITAGANQAFFIVLLSILEPDDEVIIFTPYYFNHVMSIQALNAKPVFIQRDMTFSINPKSLVDHAITNKTKAIVLTSPDNPTGSIYKRELLMEIYKIAKKNKLWIIHDETYRDFLYDTKNYPHVSLMEFEEEELTNVISIQSYSKNFGMSGYRLGYMLFPKVLFKSIIKIQDTLVVSAPVVSQELGILFLKETDFVKKWFYQVLEELTEVRNYILDQLENSQWFDISKNSLSGLGGFYLFPKLIHPKFTDTDTFCKHLISEKSVVLIPGNFFGNEWKNYVRVSFGNVSLKKAKEAFTRINDYFEKLDS